MMHTLSYRKIVSSPLQHTSDMTSPASSFSEGLLQ